MRVDTRACRVCGEPATCDTWLCDRHRDRQPRCVAAGCAAPQMTDGLCLGHHSCVLELRSELDALDLETFA
jgi:hypothetical protein